MCQTQILADASLFFYSFYLFQSAFIPSKKCCANLLLFEMHILIFR